MSKLIKPEGYHAALDLQQTEIAIKKIKDFFLSSISSELRLRRVTAPLFVLKGLGMNDDLNGVERPVTFPIKDMDEAQASGMATGSLKTSVKVAKIYKNLNLMNGQVSENTEVTFAANNIPQETFTANGQTYSYLALNYLLVATGHQTDATSYHFVRVTLCMFALLFVLDLLRDGKLTEALMNMYIGLSVLAFSLVTLLFDTGGALPMEIVFAVGIAMTAAIFIFRRNWALATTAGGMAVVYLIPPLTGTAETVPLGVVALIAGAALMVYSMLGAILGEKGERILNRDRARFAVDSGKDYSVLLVATAGMFTASMVGLDSSLFDMSPAFCVPGLFLSAVTCIAALYSMFHGRPGTCIYLLSMALVSATWDAAVILGAEADPHILTIGAFLLLISVFPLVVRGFHVLAATAALSSAVIILGILTGTEIVWTAGLLIYSVVTLIYAVNRWIGGEIGRAPLPTMV